MIGRKEVWLNERKFDKKKGSLIIREKVWIKERNNERERKFDVKKGREELTWVYPETMSMSMNGSPS